MRLRAIRNQSIGNHLRLNQGNSRSIQVSGFHPFLPPALPTEELSDVMGW
jgi:hypothetical protein